ncbi:MAG: rRNA pseudouridine synthase [Acidobacteria bacterium]|nr:rRNA pseudouridine synthase [Acidobacteriota bacterium]
MLERLQKIIADAGIASRRKAEGYILAGRVRVNGRVVQQLGSKADPQVDSIKVDGKLLRRPERVYLLLHKPPGYLTTRSDPQGRPTVMDLIPPRFRVYPAGRLDYQSEGLVLLTNDGELTRQITRAGGHCPKFYHVKVRGVPEEKELDKLRKGVRLNDLLLHPATIRLLRQQRHSWYEVTLYEGKNRQIRRMFEIIGHPVLKLKRVALGPLDLKGLVPGAHRLLRPSEVEALKRTLDQGESGFAVRKR